MKKQILFLTILLLIVSVSGCSKKESETKPETGADMPEKSSDCTFKAVVTEVNDAGIHLYLDGQELKISHYDSDYWGYSFIMPDKDIEITAEPYTYAEIWGTSDEKTTVSDDFSIKIHFGLSEYDSETGKLVKETQPSGFFGNTVEDYTTEYYLSEEQKAELFNMIMDMDFDSYPDVYNPCEGFYSDPSYTVILEVKHNGLEKKVRCYDIVSLDSAESYQKYHPDIWENISKEGKNFIILHGAIVDMLTSSAEWKALPDYDLWER